MKQAITLEQSDKFAANENRHPSDNKPESGAPVIPSAAELQLISGMCIHSIAHLNISYGNLAIASVNFIILYTSHPAFATDDSGVRLHADWRSHMPRPRVTECNQSQDTGPPDRVHTDVVTSNLSQSPALPDTNRCLPRRTESPPPPPRDKTVIDTSKRPSAVTNSPGSEKTGCNKGWTN